MVDQSNHSEEESDFVAGYNAVAGRGDEGASEPQSDAAPPSEEAGAADASEDERDEGAVEGAREGEGAPAEEEGKDTSYVDLDALIAKIQEETEKRFSQRIRNLEGHIGGLKDQITRLLTAKTAADNSGIETPSADQVREAALDPKKLEALAEDFPEWAELAVELDKVSRERVLSYKKELDSLRKELEDLRNEAVTRTSSYVDLSKEYAKLYAVHPDADQIDSDPRFIDWLKRQPNDVLEKARSSRAEDVIDVLSLYKTSITDEQDLTAAKGRQINQRLAGAIPPTKGAQAAPKRSAPSEEDEFERGFYTIRGEAR